MLSWLRRHSLSSKIVAWSFIPTVIILSIVALVSIDAYQRGAEDLVMQRNRELTRLQAAQVATEMADYAAALTTVARTIDVYEGTPARQRAALKQAADRLSVFDAGAIILDSYGVVTAAEPERSELGGQDWSAQACFRRMVREAVACWSDVTRDGAGNRQVIGLAVPISGPRGEFVGAMIGMMYVQAGGAGQLYLRLNSLFTGSAHTAYLVDGAGFVFYHSDARSIGEDFAHLEGVRAVMNGRVGALRTRDVAGRDIVSAFSPVPGTTWGLVTEESWRELMQPSQGYRQFLFVLLGLGVAIPSLLVLFGVQRIARPIADLIVAARAAANGSFGYTIKANTGDEIEELARQFNVMSAELAQSYANLEQRVADRTRELATLNAISTVVSGTLDLQSILHEALRETLQAAGLHCGIAYRLDEDGYLQSMAQQGLSDEFAERTERLPLSLVVGAPTTPGTQPAVWALASLPDEELKRSIAAEGIDYVVAVPLTAKGKLVGALVIGDRAAHELSDEEHALLDGIGLQVGMAVENARLYQHAEAAAIVAERQRLARELHDAVTQTLFSASLIADVLPRLWQRNPAEAARRLAELRELTRGALAEMRTLLHELRPASLTEMPLPDLLRQLAEATTGRSRIPVEVSSEMQCTLAPNVQVALYRIAQEALNNVAKHSGASHVQVTLRCHPGEDERSGRIDLVIEDNGCGFRADERPPTGHLGLGIMEERAVGVGARVQIDSSPGNGTRVTVTWPG